MAEARIANSDHMAEEERGRLADFRRHASLEDRHAIGVAFAAFAAFAASHAEGVDSEDNDPETYVRRVHG